MPTTDDKSKKKAKKTLPQPAPFVFASSSSHLATARTPPYVRVRVCNVSMPHLNFEWQAVPVTITVAAIKQAIIARHGGSVYDVHVWRDVVRADTRIREDDQALSLKALGVRGLPSGDAGILPVFTLHYDFEPVLCDDPIASITCQTRESQVNLKAYLGLSRG